MRPSVVSPWRCTNAKQLRISRQTPWRLRRRRLLKKGQHWTLKTPGCTRSDILWHAIRCDLALGRVPH